MRVAEWMSPDPITVSPWTSVRAARELLAREQVRHLPVVQGERLVGIVSDRDLRLDQDAIDRLARGGSARPVEGEVRWVMSRPVHTAAPDDELASAADRLLAERISALPVVDEEDRPVGILTTTDCLLALLRASAVRGAARPGER